MSNLCKKRTGLAFNIWIRDTPNHQHGPRIKVQQNYADNMQINNTVSVSVEAAPTLVQGRWKLTQADWRELVSFIQLNQALLVRVYWGEADTADLFAELVVGQG